MIRKHLLCSSFLLSLCLVSGSIFAGQLFRFNDESGTPTLSKTLPPEAAQQGYDILDDKTMRLIERVPPALSEAELAEQAQRQKPNRPRAKPLNLRPNKPLLYNVSNGCTIRIC